MKNAVDSIGGKLAEMRLIVEGAVSIFENSPNPDSDAYSLIGEALYILRDGISDSLTEFLKSEKSV